MKAAPALSEAPALSPSEVELIDVCVRIAQFIGLPKSVGEIYGLLFISPKPLALDTLAGRLNLSKGSASQGLKMLRDLGAIIPRYVPGDRRDHYVAETDLGKLLGGFFRERLQPGVADLAERLQRIEGKMEDLGTGERKLARERLAKLQSWQRQIQKVLPLLNTFLGK